MSQNDKDNIQVELPPFTSEVRWIKDGHNTDWSHEFYNIGKIHDKGIKGKGVKIAVLDTGVDLSHNSFKKAISEGRLKSVDARHGHSGKSGHDGNGHGTWCVSRYISDGRDVLGFAPECSVTSYKVLGDGGGGSLTDVIRGARMAINDGHHIISTSLGWGSDVANFKGIAKHAYEQGIVWISAAGNDGSKEDIDYPAVYEFILSCGSHGEDRKRSRFSDYGKILDVYSSGDNVLGAYTNNREARLRGTSMSTPSFGALLALVYFPLMKKYGKIDREVLKNIVKCQ